MNRIQILLALLLFASCSKELPLPAASGNSRIVLLGELSAGDTMLIRAARSIPFGQVSVEPDLIKNLAVTVVGSGGPITLQEYEDFSSYYLYTVPFSSPNTVKAANSYTIKAEHAELGEVSASVSIPGAFSAILAGKAFTTHNNDSVLQLDIDIDDVSAANAQYVVEVIKQPVSVDGYFFFDFQQRTIKDNQALYDSLKRAGVVLGEYYDTVYSGQFNRQYFYASDLQTARAGTVRRLFLKGGAFGGTQHRIQLAIPRRDLYGEQGQFAETIVYIKSVATDYYEYLKAYDVYSSSSELGGNAVPSALPGNVKGGFGMIGGVYRQSFKLFY